MRCGVDVGESGPGIQDFDGEIVLDVDRGEVGENGAPLAEEGALSGSEDDVLRFDCRIDEKQGHETSADEEASITLSLRIGRRETSELEEELGVIDAAFCEEAVTIVFVLLGVRSCDGGILIIIIFLG